MGSESDQLEFSKHIRCDAPIISNPSLQVWFMVDPNVKLSPMVLPLPGVPGSPQLLTK